jgi:hypothetical protein
MLRSSQHTEQNAHLTNVTELHSERSTAIGRIAGKERSAVAVIPQGPAFRRSAYEPNSKKQIPTG